LPYLDAQRAERHWMYYQEGCGTSGTRIGPHGE
jgi:hypothetical protein